MFLGCHLSISKGYLAAGKEAIGLGANVFQFFTRNPRGSKAKELDLEDVQALLRLAKEEGFGPLVAHAPYTLNPASFVPRVAKITRDLLGDDFVRLASLPGAFYNLHPGNYLDKDPQAGMDQTMALLNEIYPKDSKTVVLLETMAGKGTEIGRSFEELAYMLERFKRPEMIGVCLDTCHIFDAGYDIVADLDGVVKALDKVIGLDKLKAIHLNDSLNEMGSRKDRHAKIDEGQIGLTALVAVLAHPQLSGRPVILETPNELPGYAKEIKLLKDSLAKGQGQKAKVS
ncbi:MAG: deoxyribonuclease IV [Deltaproteobacteria bacterium]|nr:deoxyribonuclease IV [Deltaproteobacteria bacterium]